MFVHFDTNNPCLEGTLTLIVFYEVKKTHTCIGQSLLLSFYNNHTNSLNFENKELFDF